MGGGQRWGGRPLFLQVSQCVCVFSNVYMLSLFRMGCFSLGTFRDLGSRVLQFESSLKSRALQNIVHVAGRATKSHEHDMFEVYVLHVVRLQICFVNRCRFESRCGVANFSAYRRTLVIGTMPRQFH